MAPHPCCTIKTTTPTRVIHNPFQNYHTCKLSSLSEKREKSLWIEQWSHYSSAPARLYSSETVQTVIKSIAFCVRWKFSPYRFKHCRESRRNPCRWPVQAAVRGTHQIFKYFLQMPSTLWHNYTAIQLLHEPILPHGKAKSLLCIPHTTAF